MNRKLLVLMTLLLGVKTVRSQDRPNILWIVSEDNTTLLACDGDEFATTPHLDKFATESIRYKNAFSSAPVCAPSRNKLITGMYPPSYPELFTP